MSASSLFELAPSFHAGQPVGITSICTAHPVVIEAALLHGRARSGAVLIEATCNQVNQDGGYTGMTPSQYRDAVLALADRTGFARERLILGGDHLGPNPWRKLPAAQAMAKAETMVAAYAAAGFGKIHLDASMACADDPAILPAAICAARATRLAIIAETAAREAGHPAPAYVIGTEVPVPGGAHETLDVLAVTSPASAAQTLELHRDLFAKAGLEAAFARVVGLVVQPGVEFGHRNVVRFDPAGAQALSGWLNEQDHIVFEAHSTDYQTTAALSGLVAAGFGILKVGPGLTFALREAYYGLDAIAAELFPHATRRRLPAAMEAAMIEAPGHWAGYYDGDAGQQRLLRHFSYSDRIRYYWAEPGPRAAVGDLMTLLDGVAIDETLISQFLPRLYPAIVAGVIAPDATSLLHGAVAAVLDSYADAADQRVPATPLNQ
jgi:D-tagatose 6-phosphate 4-epimerase